MLRSPRCCPAPLWLPRQPSTAALRAEAAGVWHGRPAVHDRAAAGAGRTASAWLRPDPVQPVCCRGHHRCVHSAQVAQLACTVCVQRWPAGLHCTCSRISGCLRPGPSRPVCCTGRFGCAQTVLAAHKLAASRTQAICTWSSQLAHAGTQTWRCSVRTPTCLCCNMNVLPLRR